MAGGRSRTRRILRTAAAPVLVCLLLFTLPTAAQAVEAKETPCWDGGNTASWNTTGNWTANAVPTSAGDVVIPASPFGGNFPRVDADAQITAGAGGSDPGDTTVTTRRGATIPADAFMAGCKAVSSAVERYFNLSAATSSGLDPSLRLYYDDAELNGNDEGKLELWHCEGDTWQRETGTYNRDAPDGWVEVSGVESFSPFILSEQVPTNLRWNRDGDFELSAFDTGELVTSCVILAPWGSSSWGIEASAWENTPSYSIDKASFSSDGHTGYLFGRDDSNRWSFARYIQGDVWGGSNCTSDPPIPWYIPTPLSSADQDLTIKIDLYTDTHQLLSTDSSWVMYALNVWLSSPELPAGPDKTGHKPIVLDLVFYLDCNWSGCGLHSFEDGYGFHYQAMAGSPPEGDWQSYTVDLSHYIDQALNFGWGSGSIAAAADTLKVYQLEFVIEVNDAEAAAGIDNFWLEFDDTPTAVTLSSLTAIPGEAAIEVAWETTSELSILGFNLYRADDPVSRMLPLNEDIIPVQSPLGVGGAQYRYLDRATQPGLTYYYWLEVLDLQGGVKLHGPASATAGQPSTFRVYLPLLTR